MSNDGRSVDSRLRWPVRLGAAIAAGCLIQAAALPATAQSSRERAAGGPYPFVMGLEAKSRGACEENPKRVFVGPLGESECVAYYVLETGKATRHTVIFLDGDVPPAMYRDAQQMTRYLETVQTVLKFMATRHGVRYVYLARPGVFGSSGTHGLKARHGEVRSLAGAIDAVKERLGIERVVLSGQSGGSVVIAGLLARGREDIACGVMASGLYNIADLAAANAEMFNLSSNYRFEASAFTATFIDGLKSIESVRASKTRRLFVVGDPKDKRTPFDQQRAYADALRAAGHHAELIPAAARDEEHHGLSLAALDLAGRCANGESDAAIRKAGATR